MQGFLISQWAAGGTIVLPEYAMGREFATDLSFVRAPNVSCATT